MCPPPVATASDNRLRNYNSAIDNVSTNLLPTGLQDFFQVLHVSNATKTVNKLLGELSRSNSLLRWSLGYSAATFLVPRILAHEDALANGQVIFTVTYTTSAMMSHGILITEEYLIARFFYVFLFVYVLQVLQALFYANFYKLSWKFE